MAALRAGIRTPRAEVTRLGHSMVETWVNSWEGQISVFLGKEEKYDIWIHDKANNRKHCLSGSLLTPEVPPVRSGYPSLAESVSKPSGITDEQIQQEMSEMQRRRSVGETLTLAQKMLAAVYDNDDLFISLMRHAA